MYRNGLLIKHHTRRLKPEMDEDILSSMLIAVQKFVKDSFRGENGELEELKFGEYSIKICRGKYVILAAIVSGEDTEHIRVEMNKAVSDIERHHGSLLKTWKGNMDSIKVVNRYVKNLINGKYT